MRGAQKGLKSRLFYFGYFLSIVWQVATTLIFGKDNRSEMGKPFPLKSATGALCDVCWFYKAYGLSILSALALPELIPSTEPGEHRDIVVRIDTQNPLLQRPAYYWSLAYATPRDIFLNFQGIGSLLVRKGREILLNPRPESDDALTRMLVLGPGLGGVLHQRGMLVLHSGAVQVDGRAVVFIGKQGLGKSSIAAAMYHRGHAVVADDVVAIDFDTASEPPNVLPGFPLLKIFPEVAEACMGDRWQELPTVTSNISKRVLRTERGFPQSPLPLAKVYLLEEADRTAIEPLSPREALIELVRHTYFVMVLKDTQTSARHFQQCTKLLETVEVARLRRPDDVSALFEVADRVEEDVRRLS